MRARRTTRRAPDLSRTTFDRDERWRSISGCGARGERRPLAVLRWCNAIACHFFYALCFSLRVSRPNASYVDAKSRRTCLFHARTFAPSASPRPPFTRKAVCASPTTPGGETGPRVTKPTRHARARSCSRPARRCSCPPPRRAHRAPAAAVPRVRPRADPAHPVSQLAGLLAPRGAGWRRAGRARGSRAAQGGRQGSTDRGPLRVQRAAGAGEPAPEGGGRSKARGLAAKFGETRDGGCSPSSPGGEERVLRRRRASVLGTASARKASSADGDDPRDSADAAHVDEGMRLREAMKKVDGRRRRARRRRRGKIKKKRGSARRAKAYVA